jgi:tRNA-modifying protein YgfZ
MASVTHGAAVTDGAARRPRAYVRVQGPDAVDYLNRMLSNDVPEAGSVDALLLTPKARVIAPVLVWRRGADDVLLLTEPELGDVLHAQLTRMRFAAKCEIVSEDHVSTIVLGVGAGIPNHDYGVPAVEVLDSDLEGDADLERLRIEAATPRYGRELDDRVLPAEAGLEERAISFTKGCYPGQEPIARQHHRGKVNRRLRVLEVEGSPAAETPVVHGEKEVGRVTSAVDGLALAYVRVEVPDDAELVVDGAPARLHWPPERP